MATPIRIKRSAVSGKKPQNTDLQVGELALNTYDGSLFTKRDTGGVGIATTVSNITPWVENFGGTSINYSSGDVGIGTTNPSAKLEVRGDARITGILTVGESSLTLDGDNDIVNVGTALTLGHTQGIQFLTQNLHSQGFEVNRINASGIVTASSFDGDLATTNLTGTITNTQLAGSIANDKLSNSSVNYGGITLSLGSTDATPAFDLQDATNYPYTSLTGITTTIVGDTTPKLGGDLDGNSKNIYAVGVVTGTSFESTVATGTAPFVVASTTKVTNLNADLLDGKSTANSNVGNSIVTRNAAGGFIAGDVTFGNIVGTALSVSGITTITDTLHVGTGVTVDGNAGIISATTFSGNATTATLSIFSFMTNNSTTDETVFPVFVDGTTSAEQLEVDSGFTYNPSTGILSATTFKGNLDGTVNTAAQPNITSLGTLSSLDVNGDVGIGGTLTYEDVTNIDSVGIITAQQGIHVGAGVSAVGVVTATQADIGTGGLDVDGTTDLDTLNVAEVSTFSDKIVVDTSNVSEFKGNGRIKISGATQTTKLHLQRGSTSDVAMRFENNHGSIYAGLAAGFNNNQRFIIGLDADLSDDPILIANETKHVIVGSSTTGATFSGATGDAKITGIVTAASFVGSGASLTGLTGASSGTYGNSTNTPVITVDGNGRITTISTSSISGGGGNVAGIDTTGTSVFNTLDIGGDIDVDGHTELDNLNVSGVSTFTSSIHVTGVGSSVGIGTNNPDGQLHISSGNSGDCRVYIEADADNNAEGDNPFIIFKNDGGIENASVWCGNTDGGTNDNSLNLSAATAVNGGIRFFTSGTDGGWETAAHRARITPDGEFLINAVTERSYVDGAGYTQTPKLQVESNSNVDTAISLRYNSGGGAAARRASFIFARTADGTAVSNNSVLGEVLFMGEGNSTLEKAASIRAEVDGTPGTNDMPGRLIFSTSDDGSDSPTERLRITSDGKVGIGTDLTTTPSSTLTVSPHNSTSGRNISLYTSGAVGNKAGLFFNANSGTGNLAEIQAEYKGTNEGELVLSTSMQKRLTINKDGQVGINTTTPSTQLQIVGSTASVDSTGGTLGIRQKGDTNNDGITLTSSHANSARIYKDADGKLHIYNTGGSTDDFVLTNGGNVGIGITNSSAKLDVTDGTTSISFTRTNNNPHINFKANNVTEAGKIKVSESAGGGVLQVFTKTTGGISTERLQIDTAGRLVIGHNASHAIDANYGFRLQVSGTNFATSGIAQQRFEAGVFGATLALAHSRNDTQGNHTILNINDEYGKIRFYGSDGTDFDGYGAEIVAKVETGIAANSTPGRLEFYTTESGSTNAAQLPRMSIRADGKVGIGTNNPQGDLQVGTGVTVYGNSGIVSATTFSGNADTATTAGTVTTAAQPNITSLGTLTSLNVNGDVGIGGTLTYEDVTNIDSLGIITARSGILVSAGSSVGIGTVPASGTTLDIDASGGGVLAIRRNSVNTNNKITLSSDGTDGTLESTNGIIFRAGGSEALTINDDQDIVLKRASVGAIFRSDTGGGVYIAGGNDTNVGGNINLFGSGHASHANHIRFRNGSTVAVEIDENGKVGVGTESPVAHLQVYRKTTFAGNPIIQARSNNGSTNELKFEIDGDGDAYFNGKVGVGTISPTSMLHIHSGTPRITMSDSGTGAHHRINADSSVGNFNFDIDYDSVTSTPAFIVNIKDDEKMRIESDGKVAIGTNNPTNYGGAVKLALYSAGHTGFTIAAGTSSDSNIFFADGVTGDATYRGNIKYAHNGDSMRFHTAAAERLRISSGGQIGIEKTPKEWNTSYRSLQIHDAGYIAGSTDDSFVAIGANNYLDTDGNYKYTNTDHTSQLYQVDGTLVFRNAGAAGNDSAITWSERLRIASDGQITVKSTDNSPLVLNNTNSNGQSSIAFQSAGSTKYTVGSNKDSDGNIDFFIYDQVNSTHRFNIKADGNIGIGTDDPKTELDVRGSISMLDSLVAPYGGTVTYTVTVAAKVNHRYPAGGSSSSNAYYIDGIESPVLTLTPGRTYRFTHDNTGSHPLKFYHQADKTTLYTSGVDFQNTYTEITVSESTPSVLYYQCTAHGYMGNAVVTNSEGLYHVGVSTFTSVINANNGINLTDSDNKSILLGSQDDLRIKHDGSNAEITDEGRGSLRLGGDQIVIGNATFSENNAVIKQGAAGYVVLKQNGTTRLQTTSTGVVVTGILTATSFKDANGNTIGGGGGGVTVQDEGSALSTTATTLNFEGSGVSATGTGAVKTITIAGGASQDVFKTIAVSGQDDVVADSATDTLTLVAGSNVTITTDNSADSVTVGVTTEQVQDIVGAMFSGNTETNITATYQDSDGTIDLVASGGGGGGGSGPDSVIMGMIF